MQDLTCDLCIIGAGSGGLSMAAGASQMGADVILIEGHKMGGDCLNYGCVPSKALLAAGRQAHRVAHPGRLGVAPAAPEVDYAEAKDHVARVIDTIAPVDSQERFEGFGVRVIREWGRFSDPDTVVAGDYRIKARRFVIATGSSPFVPPIPGLDGVSYHTNETIFELREKPSHLMIIGGGPIGLEMAQAHRRLGCEVTVIEGARAMAKDDPEAAAIVVQSLRDEGVTIVEGAQATAISEGPDGITVETPEGSHTGSHLLVAVGRKVNIDRLDLDAGNVAHDRAVKVDGRLRSTTNRKVYAAGDAAGGMQFTHLAGYHAGVLIPQILLSLPSKAKTAHIPWCTYTSPELAQVGLTADEAIREHGRDKVEVVRFDYHENDRAIASGETKGFVKVAVVKGKPVGATIVGAQAGELISMWAMALANGLKMRAISNTVLPYPTLSEVNKRAAGAYFSPRLFESDKVKKIVRLVQKYLP
ncbi:dihydrolipoyl dehydrogenase family protein [Palleronia caenipelagi]|uniref:Dihydrolipoamide dehydrogenase n=1 Tax=Palleronia caenipelagi TaxID=2489174 RepID=A0A547Q751_9RHOB|nr:FAD-dependent oxidoreductase [Palleronia caenipelagi]TRD22199.1 dihydrolipoamide dehydrogenase [Palleronia caenipelagi]